jgi:DNA-binding GntR family transcriptional regulator
MLNTPSERSLEPEAVTRRPTAGWVVERIKDALVTGRLRPGNHVSASGLARELGVSHIPVREALKELHADGHLLLIPNRGFFVPELSRSDVFDIYRWRRVLEDEAQRQAIPLLSNSDLEQLTALCAVLRSAARRSDIVVFHRVNHDFHFAVFGRTQSPRLIRMLEPLWRTAFHYQSILIRKGPSLQELQDQHEALLDAYHRRDVERANAVMHQHRSTTLGLMEQIL